MTTTTTLERPDSGGRYVLYLFVSSFVLIAVFFVIYRDSRRAVEIPVSAILGDETPGFMANPSAFRAKGGLILQLYVPERNVRLHVVIPESPSEDRVLESSLLEAVRSYRISGDGNAAVDPLLLTFFSSQFDSRRAEAKEQVPLKIAESKVTAERVFVEKRDEHFLMGLFRLEGYQVGFIGFSVGKALSADDLDGPLTWISKRLHPTETKELLHRRG